MYAEVDAALPRHPKSLRLASLLNESRAWTRMVELWLWAMEYALDGDLSRFTDDEISQAMGYQLETEKNKCLKKILIDAGFLDSTERIHDWKDRGKRLKKKALAMKRLRSARGQHVTATLPPVTPDRRGEDQRGDDQKGTTSGDGFESFWTLYPKKRAKPLARDAFKTASKKAALDVILAGLRRQAGSEDWAREDGKWIPWPAKWLKEERWLDEVSSNGKPFIPTGPEFSKPKNFLLPVVKEPSE